MWFTVTKWPNKAVCISAFQDQTTSVFVAVPPWARHEKLAPPFWDAIREAWPIETAIFA
jgi:hypothetical protein